MTTPSNLYEQLSPTVKSAVASLLGFSIRDTDAFSGAAGFRNNLRDMPPMPESATIGDVLIAYVDHIRYGKQRRDADYGAVKSGRMCPECGCRKTESNGAAEYRCTACDHRWGTEHGGETYGF